MEDGEDEGQAQLDLTLEGRGRWKVTETQT
jgi:hypothetical protein